MKFDIKEVMKAVRSNNSDILEVVEIVTTGYHRWSVEMEIVFRDKRYNKYLIQKNYFTVTTENNDLDYYDLYMDDYIDLVEVPDKRWTDRLDKIIKIIGAEKVIAHIDSSVVMEYATQHLDMMTAEDCENMADDYEFMTESWD